MADHQVRSSRIAEQLKSLFVEMQKLAKEAKHQDFAGLIQSDPQLSQLQRHVLLELIHDEPMTFSYATDELTGFLQRSSLLECLARALVDGQLHHKYLAICFIDLDGFKEINDQYGHVVGDQVLSLVGTCLNNSIRSGDLLCRWGGDEFVVVLQDIDRRESALTFANRLLNAISSPLRLNADEPLTLFLGASIGVAFIEPNNPRHTCDALALIDMADQAMYRAKRAGKNCIQFAV